MKKRDSMKNQVSILTLCLLFLITCANTDQHTTPPSRSNAYDGIWDGYAQTPYERGYIKMEFKNGIMSGLFELDGFAEREVQWVSSEKEINGYITSDNNLIINPFSFCIKYPDTPKCGAPTNIICETNLMSPNRIEGTYHIAKVAQALKYDWFVVKPATGKSDNTMSNVKSDTTFSNDKVNEKEPWTGKLKVESTSQGAGIWAMKQEGNTVKSTKDSVYDFKGKIQGNKLKGTIDGPSNSYNPFIIELLSDSMSFKGTANMGTSRTNHLKGHRIE